MTPAGGSRRSHGPIVVIAVVGVVLIGALLVVLGRPGSERVDAGTIHVVGGVAADGSGGGVASMPSGPARDEEGALSTAIRYAVGPQRWLYLDDEQVATAVEDLATPAAATRLSADVVDQVRAARDGLSASPGRVWWLVQPLAWQVESTDPDEATVAVWTVSVLSAEEVAAPQSEWATVTVELDWIDDRWLVDDVREQRGPTPLPGPRDQPWDAGPFDDALDGFTRVGEERAR